MRSRPILFSAPMVRALLDGTKTQTRRIVTPAPDWGTPGPCCVETPEGWQGPFDYGVWAHEGDRSDGDMRRCRYGRPGDLLYVRETWAHVPVRGHSGGQGDDMGAIYRADGDDAFDRMPDEWDFMGKWTPSIHMPRWASRLTLRLTNVRVERLQDISEADAQAEGIEWNPRLDPVGPCKWGSVVEPGKGFNSPVFAFEELWRSMNGPESWEENPWVWALTFKVIKQNVDEVLRREAA